MSELKTMTENLQLSSEEIDQLKKTVRDFVRKEYGEELVESTFDDLSRIGIAETNAEDREDIVIDMVANVKDLTLDQYINGDKLDSWHYDSLDSLLSEIRNISFDELVSLGPKSEERVAKLMKQFPAEQDFLRNTEDAYALYQLKYSPERRLLSFTGMDELKKEAKHFREEILSAADQLDRHILDSKEQAEGMLKSMGMTVVPNEDPWRITLQNEYGMKGNILLDCEKDVYWPAECDIHELDKPVRHENYSMLYSGPISSTAKPEEVLNILYAKFNLEQPPYFTGHSMSVSDVVVLRQNGQTTAYFCDDVGFIKVPDFLADQPLRNAEMQLEDDYNMLDGIINNGPKQEEKPSLRTQLGDIKAELDRQDRPHLDKKHTKEQER